MLFLAAGCIPWKLPATTDGAHDADSRADTDADADSDADANDGGPDGSGDAEVDVDVESCDLGYLPVFPGAVGYGTDTRAAYGLGDEAPPGICVVDVLESDELRWGQRNGVDVSLGSLEGCIEWNRDGKIIIFEISGTIDVPGTLAVNNNFVTIAGQTAPPPGIELRRTRLSIGGHDILVQHLASRYGDGAPDWVDRNTRDGLLLHSLRDGCEEMGPYNVVIDHLSIAWAQECSVQLGSASWERRECMHDISLTNTIIAEGLQWSDGDLYSSSRGLQVWKSGNIFIGWNILLSNHRDNPRIESGFNSGLIINNLIYNARDFAMVFFGSRQETTFSIIGNVNRPGPSSEDLNACCVIAHLDHTTDSPFAPESRLFFDDNQCGASTVADGGSPVMLEQESPADRQVLSISDGFPDSVLSVLPVVPMPPCVEQLPSDEVYDHVLAHAGARPGERTPGDVDSSLLDDIRDVTGRTVDNAPSRAWPEYAVNTRNVESGMPDEIGAFPSDPHGDDDDDGYTNLEEWIHKCSAAVE